MTDRFNKGPALAMSETFLTHRSGRWAKWAVALLFASAVGYWAEDLRVPPNGGSVLDTRAAPLQPFSCWYSPILGGANVTTDLSWYSERMDERSRLSRSRPDWTDPAS